MNNKKYERITGEELPQKVNRIKNPVRLNLADFWRIKKSRGVSGWGSVQNNPCIVYQTEDGRHIEEYNATGLPSIFIEGNKMKEQLDQYLNKIYQSYTEYYETADVSEDFKQQQLKDFKEKLRYTEGKNYYKVITGTSVHSFIVKEDGPKFKKGDILKAASWALPAKNKARGNLFTGYVTMWTGALYLR